MDSVQLWREAVRQVTDEYLSLDDNAKNQLAHYLSRIGELKESIAALAAADQLCAGCGGVCCRFGRHHFTVVDLLGYLHSGKPLFSPDFDNPLCPYHNGETGCLMPAALRPYNCIIFICEEVEQGLTQANREALAGMEIELKAAYGLIERLCENRFENGLLITFERSLATGGKILGCQG